MGVFLVMVLGILIITIVVVVVIFKSEKKKKDINKRLSDCISTPSNKLEIDHERKYQETGSLRAKKISTGTTRNGSIKAISSLAQKVNEERGDDD